MPRTRPGHRRFAQPAPTGHSPTGHCPGPGGVDLPQRRPDARRAGHRGRRHRTGAGHVLSGRFRRRRLEEQRLRPELAQRVRRLFFHPVDWRYQRVADGSQHPLRGHGLGRSALQRDRRARYVSLQRRRRHLGRDRSTAGRADRGGGDRSAQQQRGVGRGDRPAV